VGGKGLFVVSCGEWFVYHGAVYGREVIYVAIAMYGSRRPVLISKSPQIRCALLKPHDPGFTSKLNTASTTD
jgi:hypothetical protein